MFLVPVIDLMGGRVVQARGGKRDQYGPVRSKLCSGSAAAEIVQGYLGLYPFSTLYIADLDAIEGNGDNFAIIEGLGAEFPALDIWVDAGLSESDECFGWLARGIGQLVLGSESQKNTETLESLLGDGNEGRIILSLDFKGGRFLGSPDILERPDLWPRRVIAMTLDRVGGAEGPDLGRLGQLMAAAPGDEVFAAGGVRGVDDLMALARLGVSGVLTASALHDGRLGRREIETIDTAG